MWMRCHTLVSICMLLFALCEGRILAKGMTEYDTCVFTLPYPPAGMNSVAERAEYVATHYWQGLDYSDESWFSDSLALEQLFVDWIPVLSQLPPGSRTEAVSTVITYGENYPRMQLRLAELAEKYFYQKDSPYHNDELYIPILRVILDSPRIDGIYIERFRYQLVDALKNRPDTAAADFVYVTADNRKRRLYKLQSDYILLYFFNPDCGLCKQAAELMRNSSVISAMLEENRLYLLAVYPGEDKRLWKESLKSNPELWTLARYADVEGGEAYNLPSLPDFYLLDNEKKVLLKDASAVEVENYLSDISQHSVH